MIIDLTLDVTAHQEFFVLYRNVQRYLEHTTKLHSNYIECLLMTYYKFILANGKRSKYLTRGQLIAIYQVYLNVPDFNLVDEVMSYIDPGTKNAISPIGFVKLWDIWWNSDFKQKMSFCFGVYESGGGFITKNALQRLCRDSVYSESLEDTDELLAEYIEFVLRKMDVDRDGRISFEDYSKTVEKNPGLLQFMGTVIPDTTSLQAVHGNQMVF